jgi:hypothetical protein
VRPPDRCAQNRGVASRTADVQCAVEALRAAELAPAYRAAWDEWHEDGGERCDRAAGDGLPPERE